MWKVPIFCLASLKPHISLETKPEMKRAAPSYSSMESLESLDKIKSRLNDDLASWEKDLSAASCLDFTSTQNLAVAFRSRFRVSSASV